MLTNEHRSCQKQWPLCSKLWFIYMCFWLPFSCLEALVWTKFISATFYHWVSRWSGRRTASSTDWPRTKTDGVLLRKCLQRTKVGILLMKCRFCKLYILVSRGRGEISTTTVMCELESWIQRASVDGWGEKNRPFPLCVPCPHQRRKQNWSLA